jgi:hypothetical protein
MPSPEELARKNIDKLLTACGWIVQDYKQLDLSAGPGKQADVHTLLRLPTGIFYAQGVKANVLFFDRKPAAEKPIAQEIVEDLQAALAQFAEISNDLKK